MTFDWRKLRPESWEKRTLLLAAAISLIPILAATWLGRPATAAPNGGEAAGVAVDTYIPKGFVLVPIEVANYEAVDSILGSYGVVDLFRPGATSGGKSRLVARNVRLLRAPQNPSHFAVLVPEADAHLLLQDPGPFGVTLKPPAKAGTEFVKTEVEGRAKRSIVYERD